VAVSTISALVFAGGATAAHAAAAIDGKYRVTVTGKYSFKEHFYAPAPGTTFIPTIDEHQRLAWQESLTLVVRDGKFYSETREPLKLEGSLKATNHQAETQPADRENCDYSAWPNPLHNGRIAAAGVPDVEVNGVGVIHPQIIVNASIPSQVGLQVDQHGTTTGAYLKGLACENPKGPGTSVLLSDEDDSGGVRANFHPGYQLEFGDDASPIAKFTIGSGPDKPHVFETGEQRANFELHVIGASGPTEEQLERSLTTTVSVSRIGA
jgi:hypothetical protein